MEMLANDADQKKYRVIEVSSKRLRKPSMKLLDVYESQGHKFGYSPSGRKWLSTPRKSLSVNVAEAQTQTSDSELDGEQSSGQVCFFQRIIFFLVCQQLSRKIIKLRNDRMSFILCTSNFETFDPKTSRGFFFRKKPLDFCFVNYSHSTRNPQELQGSPIFHGQGSRVNI